MSIFKTHDMVVKKISRWLFLIGHDFG